MIKAIIFDMVGPLLLKDPNYKYDVVAETAETLRASSRDDREFLKILKENAIMENLNLDEILERIVKKYSKNEPAWNTLLPKLKKQNYHFVLERDL